MRPKRHSYTAAASRRSVSEDHDAVRRELLNLRRDFEDLRVQFPDALVEGDLETERVVFMNRLALIIFGYDPDGPMPDIRAHDIFADFELERARQETKQTIEQGYAAGGGARYIRTGHQDLREFVMRRKDGSLFPAEIQSTMILDANDRPRGMRTVIRDISERKEMEARLEELSLRDPLTGCYNRRYLDRRRSEIEDPQGHWGCILFDLVGFKQINDTYGHDEGDRVLRGFAHFLARHHRSEDILIRLGGDEFALFIRADTDQDRRAIADRIVEGTSKDSPAAVSVGVAFRLPDEDVAGLLARADQVMYAAKGRSLKTLPARS